MCFFTGFFSDFFLGLSSSVNVTNLFQVRILLLMLPPQGLTMKVQNHIDSEASYIKILSLLSV